MSYSQNDEERAIVSFFEGRTGRFLDIGAHDGVSLSNTRRLAELGWSGTLVEPSPAAFCKLMETYRDRPDMRLINAAIVSGYDYLPLKFHDSRGDFVSTFNEQHRELWAAPGADGRKGVEFQKITVVGMPMIDLLSESPRPQYPFVNIDVEGMNFELFAAFCLCGPHELIGVELFCVEYQERLKDIEDLAAVYGYRRYHVTNENVLLAHR